MQRRAWHLLAIVVTACGAPEADGPAPPCGTGRWRPGALEIHHIDVGQADATLVVGPTGRTLLIDAGEPRWDGSAGARTIGDYVRAVLGCARLDHVLLTHFHVDHVGYPEKGGLWHLVEAQGFSVGKTLHRDLVRFRGEASGTQARWREWLAGAGARALRAEVAREGEGQVALGPGVRFTIVGVDGNGALRAGDLSRARSPPSENDYSVAALLRYGRLDYFIAGDLSGETFASPFGHAYHDVEVTVARELPDVDVYRVSHHGSDHSSSPVLLAQIDPEVAIASVGDGNPHGHPRQAAVERLAATSRLYLTEEGGPRASSTNGVRVLGHVVLRTEDGTSYTVGADQYLATDPARVDADGDGYFREADPDDADFHARPAPRGGCGPAHRVCP